jgi:hypothetical protein
MVVVVDSHGRVFGVQKWRVIDSSSFALTSPGHTQGATCKYHSFQILERFCSLVVDAHAEKLVDDIAKGKQGIKRDVRGRSSLEPKTGPKRKKGGKLC